MKKVFYPGSTSKCAPAGVINRVELVDERDPERIDIHWAGTRGGEYMTSTGLIGAVELLIRLEEEITRLAAKQGFTHPAFRRLAEHRRKAVG